MWAPFFGLDLELPLKRVVFRKNGFALTAASYTDIYQVEKLYSLLQQVLHNMDIIFPALFSGLEPGQGQKLG